MRSGEEGACYTKAMTGIDPQARYLINFSKLIFKRKLKINHTSVKLTLIFYQKIKRMTAPCGIIITKESEHKTPYL